MRTAEESRGVLQCWCGKGPTQFTGSEDRGSPSEAGQGEKKDPPLQPRGDAVLQSPDLSSGNFILGFYLPQLEGNKCVLFQATELMTLCNKRKVTQWLKVFTIATEEG